MKVRLAFLVLGMVTVAFAAGETNDDHQLSLDNDDDVDIAANEDFVDEERSEDDDDVAGLERSAAAEIKEDEVDAEVELHLDNKDMAEDRGRGRRRCNSACRIAMANKRRKNRNCNKWCKKGGRYRCWSSKQVGECKRSCKSPRMTTCTKYLCNSTDRCYRGTRY